MPATRATTVQQRQEMGRLADQGESYQAVADQTGVSFWTARKWIRRSRRDGLSALVTTFGRPATGPMSGFDPLVRYVALRLKCEHKTWGAAYVVKKMDEHPLLKGKKLPRPISFDLEQRQFVFTKVKPKTKRGQRLPDLPPVRRDAKGLSVEEITGLPRALEDLPVRQLGASICWGRKFRRRRAER